MSATKWITELGILDGKFASALYINRGIHPEIKNYGKPKEEIKVVANLSDKGFDFLIKKHRK